MRLELYVLITDAPLISVQHRIHCQASSLLTGTCYLVFVGPSEYTGTLSRPQHASSCSSQSASGDFGFERLAALCDERPAERRWRSQSP